MQFPVDPIHAQLAAQIDQFPDNFTDKQKADALLAEVEKMPPAEQKRVLMYLAGIPEDKELETVIMRANNGKLMAQVVSLEDAARIKGMGMAGYHTASFTNRKQRRAQKVVARRAKK